MFGEELLDVVRDDDEIEWTGLDERGDFLKFGEAVEIVFKVIGKFIPYQDNLDMVFLDDVFNPSDESVCVERKCRDAFFFAEFDNFGNEVIYFVGRFVVLFEGADDLVG